MWVLAREGLASSKAILIVNIAETSKPELVDFNETAK